MAAACPAAHFMRPPCVQAAPATPMAAPVLAAANALVSCPGASAFSSTPTWMPSRLR